MEKFILLLYFLMLLATGSTGRPTPNNSSSELVSDGLDKFRNKNSVIGFKGISLESAKEDDHCEQMYGFLPCSKSISGHVFLILVYEYLLFHGESYVAGGGERIFKILGPGVFGACAFQIIGSLPEALILLASGLLSNKEGAQELVLTGVGLVAGSSILLLTLLWGTCVILGTRDFPNYLHNSPSSSSDSTKQNPLETLFSTLWPGYGVVTDAWTCYTARIMLVSVIPFTIIQIPRLFSLSFFWERIFILATLVISVTFLISYFFYQVFGNDSETMCTEFLKVQLFQPWIQRRQLLYIKHSHLVVDILKHMQNRTMGRLFTDDGAPNLSVIRSIFEETDQDADKTLTAAELKDFLREIKFRRLHSDKDKVSDDIMKEFDKNNDTKINVDEFVQGIGKWIEEAKKDSGKTYDLKEVLRPWIEKKREEREMMKNIVPGILEHFRASVHGNLLTENGTPDLPAIKRLFKDIDHDGDDFVSYSELRDLTMNIKFGNVAHDTDVAASKIMEELDLSGDQLINEDEFVIGLSRWLDTSYVDQTSLTSQENKDSDYKKDWEKTDKLVKDKFIDKSVLAWTKAISLVLLGIIMLGLLAEPLIHSVQNLSNAAMIPSFFIAFIFVPIATNARISISAISEARRKKTNITSLTFSEIYSTVLMNNLLGFSVLLSLIYFRGLSWNFSIEILMVLIVTAVMGCLASFSNVYPVWTSVFAYMLYPLSLVLVYVLGDFKWL
ncbi:hypothetical protein CASFOL_002284 [Castilleja foliolosa]|uniref:EF-hand domain-containing protein n=1 Tax=Castilleja foliolosa TaxID=1961234 RepID=A0ABD3EDU6_9LAMI